MKQIMVHFDFPEGNTKQYDAIWDDLRATGNANPKGLIFHAGAAKPSGGFVVTDVWESEQDFQNFGNTLMPLIVKQNIKPVQPTILPVHYIYDAKKESAVAAN